ncbi:sensor histidine kinase [Mastigocoleus testarum]|uniref:Histidine kinase n=1 Tax=Mastigocoleus testarum BC008 TaxID=371196 RepID=A0A0V7ZHB4_9CYAN|nr:CHASE2 domain-containing protein [Mastigocoleus testarum]KST63841.1 histidine kinase [Mastigocoleus testarum BC008]
MLRSIWGKIEDELNIWRVGALPGLIIIFLVILARLTGSLQFLEWMTLDAFLRWRPAESRDDRITIIGINEADINSIGTYPIPDRNIAKLIEKIQSYKPKAIGLDIVRNIQVPPGNNELIQVFQKYKNIFGAEVILGEDKAPPPPALPPERVGFIDVIIDGDGNSRRALLGNPSNEGYKFSLPLHLVKTYLASKNITLENGTRDRHAMRFGKTELTRFLPNTGGYVGTDAGGVKILVNFRSGKKIFPTLSLNELEKGNFNPQLIRDRIVLIGITAPSQPDFINTSAVSDYRHHLGIYGVDFHAHVISHLLSTVENNRPQIVTLPDIWEYLWIVAWGILGIALGRLTQSAFKNLLVVGITIVCFVSISYLCLMIGWWIPVAPVVLILGINAVGLSAFAFYEYDRSLKSQIAIRQEAIDFTFTSIHNGPLQTLAALMRETQNYNFQAKELHSKLQHLNQEIRDVGENLKIETLNRGETLYLGNSSKIDLKRPINDLFYEVYSNSVERNLPHFQTLKAKVRDFDPIEEKYLNIKKKRELCQFLEEAICNVGKHAEGVTRLYATGKYEDGWYTITVKDNGVGLSSNKENKGTKNSKFLAKELGGRFNRKSTHPKGTSCELTWNLNRDRYRISINILPILKRLIFTKK